MDLHISRPPSSPLETGQSAPMVIELVRQSWVALENRAPLMMRRVTWVQIWSVAGWTDVSLRSGSFQWGSHCSTGIPIDPWALEVHNLGVVHPSVTGVSPRWSIGGRNLPQQRQSRCYQVEPLVGTGRTLPHIVACWSRPHNNQLKLPGSLCSSERGWKRGKRQLKFKIWVILSHWQARVRMVGAVGWLVRSIRPQCTQNFKIYYVKCHLCTQDPSIYLFVSMISW